MVQILTRPLCSILSKGLPTQLFAATMMEKKNNVTTDVDPVPPEPMVKTHDSEYPGTSVQRMLAIRERVKSLSSDDLSKEWEEVRRSILWAGGLKDLQDVKPGLGYTGHSFNDYNHCDLTAMLGAVAHNENKGQVEGMHFENTLGPGIIAASLPELGPGGSWSTCMQGCNRKPPQDVAHLQFKSRIAFKLVWVPKNFRTFVLVDDDGKFLNSGAPTGTLPQLSHRMYNYKLVEGSKYANVADDISRKVI